MKFGGIGVGAVGGGSREGDGEGIDKGFFGVDFISVVCIISPEENDRI